MDGPSTGALLDGDSGLRLRPLSLTSAGDAGSTFSVAPEQDFAPTPMPSRFTIADGDVLAIAIFEGVPDGVFATPASGGSVFPEVVVNRDGVITLPYVGSLRAGGRDVAELRQDILTRIRGFATRPEASVEIKARNRGSVSVAGAVQRPGRTTIGMDMLTIQDALSSAGAPFDAPYSARVTIREKDGVQRASLAQILAGPGLPLTGDTDIIVTVEPAIFNAMGAVRRQGPVPLVKAHVSLMDALSATAGLDGMRANARGVFVFRAASPTDPDARPIIYQLDMRQPEAFIVAQRFTMLPDDTLYVTEAPVAQWAKVLSAVQGTVNVGASAATIERLAK